MNVLLTCHKSSKHDQERHARIRLDRGGQPESIIEDAIVTYAPAEGLLVEVRVGPTSIAYSRSGYALP